MARIPTLRDILGNDFNVHPFHRINTVCANTHRRLMYDRYHRQTTATDNFLNNISVMTRSPTLRSILGNNHDVDGFNRMNTIDAYIHRQLMYDRHHRQTTATDNFLNNIPEVADEVVDIRINNNNSNTNNNDTDEVSRHTLQIRSETKEFIKLYENYTYFIFILLGKWLYDDKVGILNFIVLLFTFIRANSDLKDEITKQQNRSCASLKNIICYIIACIIFINFMSDKHIFSPCIKPLTIWELLWSVIIMDYVSKLITVFFKAILACLPVRLLTFEKRGNYYLMIEATSQLYRCVATIQPWLYYLFEAYKGPGKILGILLLVIYLIKKGNELLLRIGLFCTAIWELHRNVNPSKEQLIASGGICVICHEEYSMPVRMHCKHIFCKTCISTWLNREQSCPLCRAPIQMENPIYRDGHTTMLVQVY